MPRSSKAAVLLLLAAAFASAPAFADRDRHRHRHHHGHSHLGIYFGAPLYVPVYPPPVYVPPRVIVVPPPQPPVYIEQMPAYNGDQYWYYCQQANAYYPQVIECPSGWMRIPPRY